MVGIPLVDHIGDRRMAGRCESGEWMWPQDRMHQFGVELYGNDNGSKMSLHWDGRMVAVWWRRGSFEIGCFVVPHESTIIREWVLGLWRIMLGVSCMSLVKRIVIRLGLVWRWNGLLRKDFGGESYKHSNYTNKYCYFHT